LFPNLDSFQTYNKVFCLERLPFKDDGLRIESGEEEARRVHNLILEEYKNAGYNLIGVPVMSVDERVNYILERV